MILDKELFRQEVINHVTDYGTSYMDAILHKLDEYGLEPEDAPKLIDRTMKSRLETEGVRLNMLFNEHSDESKL